MAVYPPQEQKVIGSNPGKVLELYTKAILVLETYFSLLLHVLELNKYQ
jgi:hypothetical protein